MAATRLLWELLALFGVLTLILLNIYSAHEKRQEPEVIVTTASSSDGQTAGNKERTTPAVTIQHRPDPQGPAVQKLPPPRKVEKVEPAALKPALSRLGGGMSWQEFVASPHDDSYRDVPKVPNAEVWGAGFKPFVCSAKVVQELAAPRLQGDHLKFCKWALDPKGAGVVVGKSWGKLASKSEKERFDALNCNAVAQGKNPSCDDSWGDENIRNWRNSTPLPAIQCDAGRPSRTACRPNDNGDLSCSLTNAMIDFSKVRKVARAAGMTPSKKFEQSFLSSDCRAAHDERMSAAFPFPHLFSTSLSAQRCDVVYNGTLLLFSHDDIRNVGHTMNDIMNVWVMLWLARAARSARRLDLLNIDSFKLGHNFDDEPNRFFSTYLKSLRGILKGSDLAGRTLCVKELLLQPTPPRFFVWESWFIDLPCSLIGPSALYQRWNLHVRQAYGLLQPLPVAVKGAVLLIVRNENSNMWGSQRTSRNFLNLPAIQEGLGTLLQQSADYELVVQDLAALSFRQQIDLMARASLVIGMHGAGVAMTMHMSVGSERCCGVLEIYPAGEFTAIRGHGNMVRKMGMEYDRVDIVAAASQHNGAHVPVEELVGAADRMLRRMREQPSCIHPDVLSNPYLE